MYENHMSLDLLSKYLPPLLMLTGGVGGLIIILKYNLVTRKLVKEIQSAAKSEGITWLFWEDSKKTFAFVFNPKGLMDVRDSAYVRVEKQKLLNHRKLLVRHLIYGLACLFPGVVLALLTLVAIGWIEHLRS